MNTNPLIVSILTMVAICGALAASPQVSPTHHSPKVHRSN